MQDERAERPRTAPGTGAYGLAAVVVADARRALERVLGDDAEQAWAAVAGRAGVTGTETDPEAVDRVVRAMLMAADPVVVLCGRSLQIRASSHRHLAATQHLVRGA